MKQERKKQTKLITVFVVLLIAVLLIVSLALNRDTLFGDKEPSGDEKANPSSDVNLENTSEDNTSQDNTNKNDELINNSQENVNDDVYKELKVTKRIGDIEISNIRIELIEKDKCRFTASVKNVSDKFLTPTNVSIKVINENGETEEVFGGIVTELIREEENTFTTYILADITDAYDFEFEIIDT